MKHKKAKLCAVLWLGLGLTGSQAQEAIPASGGNAPGSGGTVSYSVGQVVYTTSIGAYGSVAQGVQQPYEISVVTGLGEANGISLICSAFPNPTTDFLTLKIEGKTQLQYIATLYDLNGKLLVNKKVEGTEASIDMSNLVIATYFLKVTQSNNVVKTFKIIKN
jgi:hypothetical protein